MTRRKLLANISMVAVFAIVAVACGGGDTTTSAPTSGASSGGIEKGGTYRTATQSFGYTGAFDPTAEYLGSAWGLYGQLLIRGLMTYNHKTAEEGGDELIPDLATDMPQISADGLTYTFTLRDNVMFGPPVDRAVTTKDVEYAFERINLESLAAQYGNYYCGVIKGMTCSEKKLAPVSGIETPNDTTIVFHLEKPTGDLLNRLAMPATAAVPEEVAKCFTKAGDYGRFVISSGAYMIMGEDELDISSCGSMKPISGYNPDKGMTIVRNPNYEPSSENTDARGNYLDGVQIAIDSNVDDIFQKIQSGELDGSYVDTPPSTVEQQYATSPDLKQFVHSDEADRTWYLTMNLLAPPFDDVHVRRAVNWVLNKASIVKAYGGSLHAVPGTSVEPPTVNPATADYDPYPSADFGGDVQKALEEMKQSHYQTDSSGKCTDPACEGFLFLGRSESPWPNMNQIALQDMQEIGLDPKLSEVDTSTGYVALQHLDKLIPISLVPGWGKDYADPYGFNFFIFDSAGISCATAVNYSSVGMTPDQAKECGVTDEYNAAVKVAGGEFPSVDAKMDECFTKSGDDRSNCFADMDHYLMEEAVPWVPWGWAQNLTITSPSATYQYDAFGGVISFAWVSVNNGLAPEDVAQ